MSDKKRKQVAQVRPSATDAAELFSDNRPWEIDLIMVTNTGAAAATFSLFHDADGTTWNTSTALLYQISVDVGEVYMIEFAAPIRNNKRQGTIGYQVSVADTLTITAYGNAEGDRD